MRQNRLIPRDISESLGKLPPQAIDLEEDVLGALMLEKTAITIALSACLVPDHFYKESHREIYQAILDLFNDAEPVDPRTVVYRLRKNGKLELVGGHTITLELTSKVSRADNIDSHIRIIQEQALKRRLIELASTVNYRAYEDTEDVFELVDDAQKLLDSASGNALKENVLSSDAVFESAFKVLQDSRNEKGITGVQTGWGSLDRLTGGCQVGLIIVAARPGMGKTAVAVGMILNAAIKFNTPVALFSLEMSSNQIMYRMISHDSSVPLEKLIKGTVTDLDIEKIKVSQKAIKSAKIFIDDTPGIHYNRLRAKVRKLVIEHKIKLVVIDYLQLMKGDTKGNREQEISSISAALKNLSKELNIPVIALSQLGRGVEIRGGDKRPQLSDLRESGAIEQDANLVIMLFRPEYYNITAYDDGVSTKGAIEFIIRKHRDGALGKTILNLKHEYVRIEEYPQPIYTQQEKIKFDKVWNPRRGYEEMPTTTTNAVNDEQPF